MAEMRKGNFLIVTGLSGAGKTMASRIFEDIGFFCVDNLPTPLISRFAELVLQSEGSIQNVCLVVDSRSNHFGDGIQSALDELDKMGIVYEILFMTASDECLVNRFKESRRQHPLSPEGNLLEAIQAERNELQYLRGIADRIIDTSRLSGKALRQEILSGWGIEGKGIAVTVTSFGFKFGIPIDADIIMDVRFIDNPYYIPSLRHLSGRDEAVQDYVYSRPEAQEFLHYFIPMLTTTLPHYSKEGKSHLSVAIGCTGGQHRSISIAIKAGEMLEQQGYKVVVRHRDH